MLAVAIGTDLFLGSVSKEWFVLLSVDFVLRVTAHTERINLWSGIHYIGRCAVSTRGPGFVGNMFVTLSVAVSAADIGPCMSYGDVLLHVVHMTYEAATVISYGTGRLDMLFLTIVKKQQRLLIRYRFPAGLGICV